MAYDGTVTINDPNMVTELDAPEGYRAWVVRDDDACNDSPRGWASTCTLAQTSSDYFGTGDDDEAQLLAAWEHYRDHNLTERFARIFLGAVAYDSVTSLVDRGPWQVIGYATQADADECGADANAVLAQELETYRQWADGEVYGVIVTRESDGTEQSLWGCYDDGYGFPYLTSVAAELADEIEATDPT